MAERTHEVRVPGLPPWVELRRLLGPTARGDDAGAGWELAEAGSEAGATLIEARAQLSTELAADLAARLRGLVLDGRRVECEIEPELRRPAVRRARTEDARRRRATTPGFTRGGVRLDEEGRWSLTPEALALRMARWARGRPVVDAGCGVGGNAIAFAREGCPVVALERDAERLAMARHNAKVYGVAGRVRFVQGDALALAPEHGGPDTLLFVDPPWGREGARARRELADLPPVAELAAIAKDRYAALWAKLPPSATPAELLAGGGEVRALFGEAEGDYRRIKFLLASTAGFS